jgi:hypothetical protein
MLAKNTLKVPQKTHFKFFQKRNFKFSRKSQLKFPSKAPISKALRKTPAKPTSHVHETKPAIQGSSVEILSQ